MGKIISFAVRFFQLLFAVCALALSISAVRWQYFYDVPAISLYVTFVGAFGCLAGLLGFAAIWIEPIAGIVMSIIDVLATIFFLSGGIVRSDLSPTS